MRIAKAIAGGALFMLLAASTASAEVQLSIRNGRVTLLATNVTVRQILTEWARIGQTKVVNVERIPGGPLTLQLTNVPEREALDILLRAVTGYMAVPRPVAVATLSQYDRILVMPTAAVARVPVAAPPTPVAQQRPPVFQPPPPDADDDQPSVPPQPRGPLFPTFQLTQPVNPQQGATSATPGAFPAQPAPAPNGAVEIQNGQPVYIAPFPGGTAVGTPRPGMVIQPPVQPSVPGGFVQPPQPVPAPD
ncbi:MAG TPA: hypothetical protein VGJ39_17505 [Vicinamibacterales bacterium]